jgi:hypothetical protein
MDRRYAKTKVDGDMLGRRSREMYGDRLVKLGKIEEDGDAMMMLDGRIDR